VNRLASVDCVLDFLKRHTQKYDSRLKKVEKKVAGA
jgi:hypothetical protein